MSFDWSKVKPNVKRENNYKLFGSVMGVSGSGKSSCCGTMPGKILWLYSEEWESHGPTYALARTSKDNSIFAINIQDDPKTGEKLDLDGQLNLFRSILDDVDGVSKAFDSVVIDGLTTIEYIYANSNECQNDCITKSGAKDQWGVFRKSAEFFNELYIKLNTLNRAGLNVMCTCLGTHSVDDAGTPVFKPKLAGVGVAEAFLAKLPDRVLAVRTKEGQFKFSLKENIEKGSDSKVIDCHPRLFPLTANEVPSEISPDFSKALMLKNGMAVYNPETKKVEVVK
jgi:hypothetical protein